MSMKESLRFMIQETIETEVASKKLKEILTDTGISVIYDPDRKSLIFNFDTHEVRKKASRNAGRKRKSDSLHMTVGEVKELMKSNRPEEIYKMLGVSKATYYRRVAQMSEKSDLEWFL